MRRLLLLGAGHAHLAVLQAFARERPPSLRATLVTPYPDAVYSGMVPGVIAGHYGAEEARIALAPLVRAAGIELQIGAATAIAADAKRATLADGRELAFDVLSLDTGSVNDRAAIDGGERALATRPIEALIDAVDVLVARAAQEALNVVVVGGGAAGFELATALAYRLSADGQERGRVSLVTGGPAPLAGYPPRVARLGRRALKRGRVTVFEDGCAAIRPDHVLLNGGSTLACDAALLATGPAAPPWLRGSGLALDERGFVATGATLQSTSHPAVFAAGDVASRIDRPHPKSGVQAVRSGPALALNLRRALGGGPLVAWQPPARSLNLLSCGERRAIMAWGGGSLEGRWVWWWKDRIDRRFVAANRVSRSGPS